MPNAFARGPSILTAALATGLGGSERRLGDQVDRAMPDGDSGSATIYIERVNDNKFLMKGFDRIVGDENLPDFEAVIVRQPPQPGK